MVILSSMITLIDSSMICPCMPVSVSINRQRIVPLLVLSCSTSAIHTSDLLFDGPKKSRRLRPRSIVTIGFFMFNSRVSCCECNVHLLWLKFAAVLAPSQYPRPLSPPCYESTLHIWSRRRGCIYLHKVI